MNRVLLTGAAGFAGSHIADLFVHCTDWEIVSLDCLTYAGRLDRLAHLPRNRVRSLYHDFGTPLPDALLKQLAGIRYIVHNGAESHVARSLQDPGVFVRSNIIGTFNMLEAARKLNPDTFLYVSTDEVFGPGKAVPYTEADPLRPSNPYSASKAGGEMLVQSYHSAFGLPTLISRTMNMFGERQHPEKFVPMTIRKILAGEPVDIHVGPNGKSGTRQWLHACIQADALLYMLGMGQRGEAYHVAGTERSNEEVAGLIAQALGKTPVLRHVDILAKNGGHDLSYAIDDAKLHALGWKPSTSLELMLQRTVKWTAAHREWLAE